MLPDLISYRGGDARLTREAGALERPDDAMVPAGNVWPGDYPLPTADRQAPLVTPTVAYTVPDLYERQLDGVTTCVNLNSGTWDSRETSARVGW